MPPFDLPRKYELPNQAFLLLQASETSLYYLLEMAITDPRFLNKVEERSRKLHYLFQNSPCFNAPVGRRPCFQGYYRTKKKDRMLTHINSAKFLARMVNTVGLLCKGNEEMVPFAYRLYQRYLEGEVEDFTAQQVECDDDDCPSANEDGANPMLEDNEAGDHSPHGHNFERAHNEITAFSNTFCRKETVTYMSGSKEVTEDRNIKVYFLGIWDCVNSVAPLERRTPVPVPVKGTAQYVRHAVSVDERRVKFKPALLSQDIRATADDDEEDLKEIWFPGCHGDVGGGWPAVAEHPLDTNADSSKWTVWQKVRNLFTTRKPTEASKDVRTDPFQMSDGK